MPVERPTFNESWYRVAALRPRLRSTSQVSRQHFRGQAWHVVHDPSNNEFFRLNEPAYRFVGMLDGRRTVAEVWRMCNDRFGDEAPTQGEAIQLLGQLYTANLLHTELPPDAEGLFNRYRRRKVREMQGWLTNLLFVRLPLLDPDRFLDWSVGLFGRLFTWYGLAAWLALLAGGLYVLAGRWGDLAREADNVLAPDHLPLLYVSLIIGKLLHEFGHAFACKQFGRAEGGRGEVHVMGVMFLVFTPVPYVDVSSSWAFRSKWPRLVVGAAGMMVELALAAVAAMVWTATASHSPVHTVCYNLMFISSVSTVLFNGNPLLRYDAYYMLSDLVEIPNLQQQSRNYLYYLVKRHAWGVRPLASPAHTPGEKFWFVLYGIASTVYRIVICVAILLFVADKLFLVGAVLASAAFVAWVCVPLVKFAKYLMSSNELARVRGRAAGSTLLTVAAILGAVGLVRLPDRYRVEGIVESVKLATVHAGADGFVREFLPSGAAVRPDGLPLIRSANPRLAARREELAAELRRLAVERRLRQTQEVAAAQILVEQIEAVRQQIRHADDELDRLAVRAPFAGVWFAKDEHRLDGAYLRRGETIGLVTKPDELLIRATAGQQIAHLLFTESQPDVEIRVKDRPDPQLSGRVQEIRPAGLEQLPSPALGYVVGGGMATDASDRSGTKAAERFFEVLVAPQADANDRLRIGQRVVVRFHMRDKPLAVQAWRALLQLVQRRFHV